MESICYSRGNGCFVQSFIWLGVRIVALRIACRLAIEKGCKWISSVSILDETEIVYIARAAQRRVMSISLMPGSRLPAYCTSMGRVLLSVLSEAEARAVLEKSALLARTERTETDVDRLLADIKETRERGYAAIDQEVEAGLISVAVPLKAAGGRVVAAANIGMAASGRPMQEVVDRYLPPLLELKAELRKTLV